MNRVLFLQFSPIILCILFLFSCASMKEDVRYSYSVPTVPIRAILYTDEMTIQYRYGRKQISDFDFPGFGYLLFSRKLCEDNKERYQGLFDEYTGQLSDMSRYRIEFHSQYIPTFWMINDSKIELDLINPSFEKWMEYYDYAIARSILSYIDKNGKKGPFLVAFDNVYNKTISENRFSSHTFILDLSTFSDNDMSDAMRLWLEEVACNPENWNEGFNFNVARYKLANYIKKYGSGIMLSIHF